MEVPQFNEAIKNLEHLDSTQLSQLVPDIKHSLELYQSDYAKLGHALYRLCEQVMKIKDVKNQCVEYFEDLICTAIKISIRNQLRVGFDAMRFVFNIGVDFYKTANQDLALAYPIGKDHPLQQYTPEVGEQCDTVRPYVTSTSFCGWTRCIVLEVENNKYTIKYANSNNPNTVRQRPWFAPLGSRTSDFDWRMSLDIGSPVEALLNRVWYKSTIAEVGEENGVKKVRVTYRRFAEDGDKEDSQGNKYFGLGIGEDEWMDVLSSRIQKCGRMVDTKLCYYTFSSEEILLDDSYDIIFEEEYKQKPFYAIMRIITCKSLSLIKFIDTFVASKGIQKTLQVMGNLEVNDDIAYCMLANIAVMVPFYPRMFIKTSPLFHQLYDKIYKYFILTAKSLNPYKIDLGYFCYDMIGRRLFSLSQVHAHQNQLRKGLIKQFLKMNMEKQMLALRYLNDLINPKKPYTEKEREAFNKFIIEQKIFVQIFNSNTHEQIISRTSTFLEYLIQRQIISLKEFESIWKIVPATDTRGRAMIEKLLTQISKNIPLTYVEFLISKILSLKETELTVQNLNLLKELKNRNLKNQMQMRILSFLWDLLTVKSGNVKQSIEEEVEKVFKAFISTIKTPNVRMNLLQSMCQKLQDCKRVKNEIELLKDFIKSYPEKYEKSQDSQQLMENVPLTILDAVSFIKKRGIYSGLLNLISKTKEQGIKKDILHFIGFLFEHDFDEIDTVLQQIYEKLGPSVNFLEWVHKLLDRSLQFAIGLLEKTHDFSAFEKISDKGFEAIQNIIIDVNKTKNNINTIKTYEFKSNNSAPQTSIEPSKKEEKKDQSTFIGPLLPEVKNQFYVLVSPFKLFGMKFLEHLLLVVKQTKVYNCIIKLIIQFISNLDESIESKTEDFRREFLEDIVKQIKTIVQENKFDEKIKAKLTVYINLLEQIFAETEKNGCGKVSTHLSEIQGQILSINIDNLFDKEKNKNNKNSLPKFSIVCNENSTLWRLKQKVGQIICQRPENIDIIKYADPMPDTNHGKNLSELLFYDNQNIKVAKKQVKAIPKSNLINPDGTDVSQKFEKIVKLLFDQYKNQTINGLTMTEMETLSNQRWRGSLFRQKDRLQKMFEEHDKEKKGFLSYKDFKQFFYLKSIKNQAAMWRLINLSGFKNNFASSSSNQTEIVEITVNTQALPRRILSSPEVYDLIFAIFANENFKDVHLNFYRLLSMLQVDRRLKQQIQKNICKILSEQNLPFKLCYAIEIANSQLSKKQDLYFDFWRNNGVEIIEKRINEILTDEKSPYELHPIVKFGILPNLIKIQHMYVRQLLSYSKIVRFVSVNKINHFDPHDFVKKINELKINENGFCISQFGQKLKELNSYESIIKSVYNLMISILHRLMKNYVSEKTQYLQRLTVETVRLLGCIISSSQSNHSFQPLEMLYGVKNGSLNYRRTTIILIYIYLFYSETPHPQEIEHIIIKLLEQLPKQNKFEYEEYFMMLNEMISRYLEINAHSDHKDDYFVGLANHILDIIFNQVEGQGRTSYISDKIIMGILATIQTLIKKDSICRSLSKRKGEITQKCLFAYDIEQKLRNLQITPEMLTSQKQALHFKNYVICKTEPSREITYRIVARLHELSEDQDEEDYINKYILPVVMRIQPEVRLTSSRSLAVGLKNFGSTCYMNSMLQVLNTVGPFRNSLMKVNSEINVIKQLRKLFAGLFYSERVDYAPGDLLAAFVPPINPNLQQDTTQFLNFLFDQLEAGLSSTRYKKLLDELFKGANTVQMICHSCGYKKQNREEFFSFGVEIEGKHDLYSALEGSFQGEIISDYLCDSCQNRGETTKRNILSQIPSVMFIHLRRIVFNYDMFVNMKIHTRLEFPQEMSIQPYTKEGVELRESFGLEYMKNLSHNQEELKKFEKLAEHGKEKDYYKLKLKGVIVHSGSADVGHYYSILQNQGLWRKYDDSRVGIFAASDFENYCYGGTFVADEWGSGTSANAYVLVYEKVVKNPIQILPGEESKDVSLVKYDEFKIHNNPEDYREFWLDNHNFMVESQLLDSKTSKIFINFICKLLNTSSKCLNKTQIVSQILYRVSFHSGHIGDLLKVLVANVASVTPDIFYSYVLKDRNRTFKLLFHYDRAIRDFMSTYLQIVLLQSFRKGDEKVKLDVLMYITEMLNALPGEVAKNWLRIDGYFKFLYLLVSSSISFIQIWNLFVSKNLISTLIDYVMEKQSPVKISPKNYSLGTKSNPLDFFYGLSTISFLLRHSYGLTGKNYEASPIPGEFLFHLNNNDVACLSHMEFYRKMLRERQNWFDLAAIVHRLCIENIEFSKAICQVILEAINSITDSKDELFDYTNICLQVLKIKDDLWMNRAQMLLGVGLPSVLNQNLLTTFDEERYFYTSTIYDIFPIECLFSYSYLYRLKNTLACFQILRVIIQGCSISKQAIRYLAIQPSPSYLFPNLITWMENFIQTFLSYVSVEQKQRERIEEEIVNTLKYVQDVKAYMKENPEDGFYESLITGEIVGKKEMHSFEKQGVEIKMYEYQVFCCPSKPTKIGGNLSMDPYLESLRLTKKVTSNSNILKFFKKPGKSIALKLEPIEEDQDKQLVGLFDQYTYPQLPETKKAKQNDEMRQEEPTQQKNSLPQNVKEKEKQKQNQQSSNDKQKEEEINLEGVFVNNYFRQVEVVNKSKDKKVVSLNFSADENCNFIVPKCFCWKIFSKGNESLWMAQQNYEKGWGNLQMKCHVEEYVKEKHEKKNITSWWFKTYGEIEQTSEPVLEKEAIETQAPSAAKLEEQQKKPDQTLAEPLEDGTGQAEEQFKACPACTFINPTTNRICELCQSSFY